MQLKIECSCGANTFWVGDESEESLAFAVEIHRVFRNDHQHCSKGQAITTVFNQRTGETTEVRQPIVNEFITEEDIQWDDPYDPHPNDEELLRELSNL